VLIRALRLLGVVPVVVVCAYRLVPLALNARSWQLLLPAVGRPGFSRLLGLRWIGESINSLLPVAQVGGDVARARLVAASGVPRADAAASMIADFATGVLTQVVFATAGILALGHAVDHSARGPTRAIVLGMLIAAMTAVVLYALLRFGTTGLARRLFVGSWARARWLKVAGSFARLDHAMIAVLGRRRALSSAFGWHVAGWFSQVGETWIVLGLMGASVSLSTALAIEGVASAARGAVFFLPAGIGIQEVTIVSIGRWLGLETDLCVALGIAKRARELALGVPGLLAWLALERSSRRAQAQLRRQDARSGTHG
jgi:putative membrane protein